MVLGILVATPACVSKRDHLRVVGVAQAESAGQREQIAGLDQQRAQLESAHQVTLGKMAGLESQVAIEQARNQQLVDVHSATLDRLAAIIKDNSTLEASVQDMRVALKELEQRRAVREQRIADFRAMLARFQSMIDAGTLDVRIIDGRMVLSMSMDILFESGSATISKPGMAALIEVGHRLGDMPGRRFLIEGHTDDVPIHNERFKSNWELATARAQGVVYALLGAGVLPTQLSAASFGEFRPRTDNATDAGRAQNRRIEIAVEPDLRGLPGFDELRSMSNERGAGR